MTNTNDKQLRLFCKECGVPISRPLRALDDFVAPKPEDGKPIVPEGCLARAECLLGASNDYFGLKRGGFAMNANDLEKTLLSPDSVGCCGPDGRNAPNRECMNGHRIATEVGDCWQPHFACFMPEHVEVRESPRSSTGWHRRT